MIPPVRRLAAASMLFVALSPAAQAAIEIVPVTSPGGISAWLYADHTIPMVALEARFRGGALLDADGAAGAVSLMTSLLSEGAGALDATAYAEACQDLAARFSFDAGRDAVTVSAQILTENRDAAVDLLRSALVEPRFDPAAVARTKGQALSALRSRETDPNSIAARAFHAVSFPGHSFAVPTDGTTESVASLDVQALRDVHRAALATDRLLISVVGDITAEELGPMLDRLFGDLPAEGPDLPGIAEQVRTGSLTVIDLDIPQSVVVLGQPGITRDDPDFMPAVVMDHILGGGGFASRLTEELRERRGLTYGISTDLLTNDLGPLYTARFSTANGRAAEALDLVRAEWARMAEEGVSDAELEAAKQYLTGAYPLRFDGYGRIASQLLGMQSVGLDTDYVNIRNDLVNAVTAADIARTARRLLDPEQLTVVVVGRPEGLAATN